MLYKEIKGWVCSIYHKVGGGVQTQDKDIVLVSFVWAHVNIGNVSGYCTNSFVQYAHTTASDTEI